MSCHWSADGQLKCWMNLWRIKRRQNGKLSKSDEFILWNKEFNIKCYFLKGILKVSWNQTIPRMILCTIGSRKNNDLNHWYENVKFLLPRYFKWIRDTYPSDSNKALLLLERCTYEFKDNDKYRNDSRFVKMWIEYVSNKNSQAMQNKCALTTGWHGSDARGNFFIYASE